MGGRVGRVRGDDLRLPARATRRQREGMFLYLAGLRAPSVLFSLSTFVLWFVLFSGALCVCLSQRGPYPAPVPFAGSFQFNSISMAEEPLPHFAPAPSTLKELGTTPRLVLYMEHAMLRV